MTADRSYADSQRLAYCEMCRQDFQGGWALIDPLGRTAATFCNAAPCRRDAYAKVRMELGTAAWCRVVVLA